MRRTQALARHCLIRCRHCRIFLLTHWRNRCQLDKVCCPFGCRKEHERRESIRRSSAYYREHPDKKRVLNERRYRLVPLSVASRPAPAEDQENPPAPSAEIPANQPPEAEATPAEQDPPRWSSCPPALAEVLPKAQDPEVMEHVRVVVSLIEARPVSLGEIWQSLLDFSRQRTIGRRRPIDHTIAWLNANPP